MRHLGIESVITSAGQTYRLSRFTRRLLRQWLEFADAQVDSPLAIAEAHIAGFPDADLLIGAAETLLQDRFSFNDPALMYLWQDEIGIRYAFGVLFEKYHPGTDSAPIFDDLGLPQVETLLAKANGVPPIDDTEIDKAYFVSIGLMDDHEAPTPKTIEWHEFDAALFQNLHLTPEQIDEMTPTEITVLSRKKDDKNRSLSEGLALMKLKAQLSTDQLLELARLKQRT